MARGESVDDGECLVRALLPALYDSDQRKASSCAFTNDPELSVSRTSKLGLQDIANIFARQFAQRPPRAAFLVTARKVREAVAMANAANLEVNIVEDPVKDQPSQIDNIAHALICPFSKSAEFQDSNVDVSRAPRRLTKGISKQILRSGETWDIESSPPVKVTHR